MTKTGVIIGRFQVADLHKHPGYVFLFKTVLSYCDRVIVLIGSAPVQTKKNALTYTHRKAMFLEYSDKLETHELKDCLENTQWVENVDTLIDSLTTKDERVVLYGSRESFIETYLGNGGKRKTSIVPAYNLHSATIIREEIKNSVLSSVDIRTGIIHAIMNQYDKALSTVDAVLHRENPMTGETEYLLGQKSSERDGTKWRFPGGFFDVGDKRSVFAASREVAEETLMVIPASSFKIVSDIEVDDWRMRNTGDSIKTTICEAEVEYDTSFITGTEYQGGDDLPFIKWFTESEVLDNLQVIHQPIWQDYMDYTGRVIK